MVDKNVKKLHQVINDVNRYMSLLLDLLVHLFVQLVSLYTLIDLYLIYVVLSKDFDNGYLIFRLELKANFINN
jgi:hypothetical protein